MKFYDQDEALIKLAYLFYRLHIRADQKFWNLLGGDPAHRGCFIRRHWYD